ncbi:MAG: hypothetical protein KDB21_20020, partial [Acidimicrobiales bacterium]|nr:hypothetical protein [Acidimicrobiales bacterium]
FTHIEGRQTTSRTRVWRLAKLDGATGAVDQSFNGKVSGARVIALDSSPDGRRLYLGGYFQIVNGVETRFFATLDTATGDFSPVPQGLPAAPEPTDRVTPVFDIEATADRVYLATEWHYLHVLDARTGERDYLHWAGGQGGDFQAVKVAGNVLWAGGHDHGFTVPTTITRATDMVYYLFVRNQGWAASPRVPVQWVSAHDAASGRRLPEFVPRLNMAEGVWDIEVASNGNLWIAGDATRSGTQSVGGFAVFRPSQPGDEVDLAIGGTATQSSVYSCCDPTPRYGTPEKAIDRMTTGNFEEESSSWTLREAEPWWQLDLGASEDVSFIRLWPMTHTGGFTNWIPVDIPEMHVFVSDRPFLTDDLADTAGQSGVTEYVVDSFDDVYEEIPVGRSARYIRVQAPGVAQLGLAEVEVIEGDAPAPTPTPGGGGTDLIDGSAQWRYWDTPSSPPAGWTTVAFDDGAWSSGRTEFGFGEGDEDTVINDTEGGARVLESAFFRTSFTVDDPTALAALELRLLADDGAIVYLNGVEVVRDNVPATGSGYRLRTSTVRFGDEEDIFRSFDLPVSLLQSGENVLSVEVHNFGWWSLDLSFDARLTAS